MSEREGRCSSQVDCRSTSSLCLPGLCLSGVEMEEKVQEQQQKDLSRFARRGRCRLFFGCMYTSSRISRGSAWSSFSEAREQMNFVKVVNAAGFSCQSAAFEVNV